MSIVGAISYDSYSPVLQFFNFLTNRIMEAFDYARIIEEFDSSRLIDYCDSSRIIGQRICRPNTKNDNRISINRSLSDSPSKYSNRARQICQ